MAVVNLAAWTIWKKRSSHPLLCMGLDQYLFRSILGSPKSDFCGKHFRRERKKKTFKTMRAFFFIDIRIQMLVYNNDWERKILSANIYNAWQAWVTNLILGPLDANELFRMGTRCPPFYFSHVVVIYGFPVESQQFQERWQRSMRLTGMFDMWFLICAA